MLRLICFLWQEVLQQLSSFLVFDKLCHMIGSVSGLQKVLQQKFSKLIFWHWPDIKWFRQYSTVEQTNMCCCSCGSCRIARRHCYNSRVIRSVVLTTDEISSSLLLELTRDWLMDHPMQLLQLVLAQLQRYYVWCWWLCAKAATAVARLSHRNSVCLFVRLSHGWISQKQCKLGTPNLHGWLPGRFWFRETGSIKLFHKFGRGHPQLRCKMRGDGKNLWFSVNKSLYLRNSAR